MSLRRTCLLITLAAACNNPTPPAPEVAEAPVVAPRPAPLPLPLPLETQLSMAGDDDFIVVRDAQKLVDAGVPWRDLLTRAKGDRYAPELDQALGIFNALSKFDDGDDPPLTRGGFALRGGLVVTGSRSGGEQLLFAADKPELAAIYLTTLPISGSDRFACATEEWLPQVIACSTTPLRRSGQAGDGASRLSALRLALPDVELAEADVLFASPREELYGALKIEPGRFEVHVTARSHPLVDAFAPLFAAGPAHQLRFVQPGTSFAWARLDAKTATALLPPAEVLAELVDAALPTWTGELLVAGSTEPAGVQLRAGLTDDAPAKKSLKAIAAKGMSGLSYQPEEIPGLRITGGASTLPIGGESTTLLRLEASGADYYDSLAAMLGLSQAAGVFAAEQSLALVLGYLPSETNKPQTATIVDALPPAAAADLRAEKVLALVHLDLNASQSPAMATALTAIAQIGVASEIRELRGQNEQTALLSSVTVWATRPGAFPVWHGVVELIGHTADDEGRAALAAVDKGSAAAPAEFAALAERYPHSRRAPSYRLRAGAGGKGALAGSVLDLLLLIGTLFEDEE